MIGVAKKGVFEMKVEEEDSGVETRARSLEMKEQMRETLFTTLRIEIVLNILNIWQ